MVSFPKITFFCELCQKDCEGWLYPFDDKDQNNPKLQYYINGGHNRWPPLTIKFAGFKEQYISCIECHDEIVGLMLEWIKSGMYKMKHELKPKPIEEVKQ